MLNMLSRTLFVAVLTIWFSANSSLWAGGHQTMPTFDPSILNAELNAELEETIMAMADRWNSQDYSTVLEMWDQDEAVPFYLAEEQAGWFIGWPALRGYLDPEQPNPVIEGMRLLPSNIRAKSIAPDLAIAVWDLHFEMKMRGSRPIGEDVRVSGVFRKKPEGWRFIHYAESPQAPMVYIEKLFQQDVLPDFAEFLEQSKK